MKVFKITYVLTGVILSALVMTAANASDKNFSSAIKSSLSQLESSPYKKLEVYTASGSFSGSLVSQSAEVIVLKTKTGSTHLKSGKEKILLTSIDVRTITAVSVYVLDK
ncbi:MAG TPA: hypothetical protein ENJ08_18245 [Gammaproteobacteria bacterium]|nr:hypothetical protein [Gammaproteobacteria bacterium]